jgi:hypothetical protein
MLSEDEEKAAFLREVLPPRRDPVTGMFPPNPNARRGALRGRGYYNFNAVVREYVEAHGGFCEDVIIDIFRSMFLLARNGDVAAARLLLDRFCGKDADVLDAVISSPSTRMSDVERAARLQSILTSATARAEAHRQQITGAKDAQVRRITVNNGTKP